MEKGLEAFLPNCHLLRSKSCVPSVETGNQHPVVKRGPILVPDLSLPARSEQPQPSVRAERTTSQGQVDTENKMHTVCKELVSLLQGPSYLSTYLSTWHGTSDKLTMHELDRGCLVPEHTETHRGQGESGPFVLGRGDFKAELCCSFSLIWLIC